MEPLKAVVKSGRLVLVAPPELLLEELESSASTKLPASWWTSTP